MKFWIIQAKQGNSPAIAAKQEGYCEMDIDDLGQKTFIHPSPSTVFPAGRYSHPTQPS